MAQSGFRFSILRTSKKKPGRKPKEE